MPAADGFATVGLRTRLQHTNILGVIQEYDRENTHSVLSVDMNVTEMYNLERCFPRRSKSLGIRGRRLGKGYGESVHGRRLAQSKQDVAKFSRSLPTGRNGS
jgi:hypothetical protein